MTIEMQPVKSTNLAAVGYDPATQTLAVRFANGGTFHYEGVSAEKHAAMMKESSIGSYFHRVIRHAHPHRRIEEKA